MDWLSYGAREYDPGTGSLYQGNNAFIGQVVQALNTIRSNTEGMGLIANVGFFESSDTEIVNRRRNGAKMNNGSYVSWNSNGLTSAPDETGNINRPTYISLAHELAHIEDIKNGTINTSPWVGTIPNAEIYATHRENQIRKENGLSLRAYYAITTAGTGDSRTRIVRGGQSLFYNSHGTTSYQKVKAANRYTY